MKKLIRTFKQISILILAITLFGCEDDDAVLPKVDAGFTYTLNADTGTVTFINISENANTYVWTFGDETSSSEINPVKTYATGTYTVTLKSVNIAGASDTFEDTISINIPLPIELPITFDNTSVNYAATAFDGTAFEIVDNPAPGGTNNVASKVGAITNSGASFEGVFFELGTAIDLATNKTIKMNFWAEAAVDVLLKLEEGSSSTPDVIVSHGGTGWEELSFNFSATAKYSKLVLFVDGPGTTTGTFYMDDVMQIETPAPPCTPETEQSLDVVDFNLTFQAEDTTSTIVDDGAVMVRVLNPDTDNAVNTSCQVGQITRDANLEFANNQFSFASNFDFNANAGFKIKVWSPDAGTNVTIKLEGAGVGPIELTVPTTTAGAWEELTFDFASGESDKYNKIVLFMNLGTFTTGVFYVDDFMLYGTGSGGGGDCVPETTQSLDVADFNLTFQADDTTSTIVDDGATMVRVANPDFDNLVNTSCQVGQITRDANFEFANNQFSFASNFDFNTNAGFKIKVWSPDAGTNVTVKLEGAGVGPVEVTAPTTTAGEWEELTFDFAAGESDKYNKIVLFMNLSTFTTGVFYVDDFRLYAGSGGGGGGGTGGGCSATVVAATAFPVNFESCESFLGTFTDTGSMTTELADNPAKTGINTSDFVLKVVKASGTNRWAGFQNPFPNNFDATKTLKFKIYSTKANVVMRFEINSDPQDSGSGNPGPQFATITNANTWTEVEIVFTGIPPSNTGVNQVVIKPDNPDGTDGETTSSEGIYYFDDIRLE